MYRITSLIAGFFIVPATLTLAQEPQWKPEIPENVFGTRELVVWTNLQTPQPAPQPLPPQRAPLPQPGPSADAQSKSPAEPQNPQFPLPSFTGTIVKEGADYVLRGNITYVLDEQSDCSGYEGKNVKVNGNLITGSNRIHIVKIELLS